MREAHIILIPKPHKDPKLCASYRPIALLNCDLKILTKVLATRLNKVIKSLVDPNQTGFMPRRSTDMNICRLFSNIDTPHTNQGTRTIVTLDMEKAFDTVEWAYLSKVMRRIGLPLKLIAWLKNSIHGSPSKYLVGWPCIRSLPTAERYQTGLLSLPAIFALSMEPIVEALRISLEIRGLRVEWLEERVALYADNLLLFLNDAGARSTQNYVKLFNLHRPAGELA